jgi:hypothetical protein
MPTKSEKLYELGDFVRLAKYANPALKFVLIESCDVLELVISIKYTSTSTVPLQLQPVLDIMNQLFAENSFTPTSFQAALAPGVASCLLNPLIEVETLRINRRKFGFTTLLSYVIAALMLSSEFDIYIKAPTLRQTSAVVKMIAQILRQHVLQRTFEKVVTFGPRSTLTMNHASFEKVVHFAKLYKHLRDDKGPSHIDNISVEDSGLNFVDTVLETLPIRFGVAEITATIEDLNLSAHDTPVDTITAEIHDLSKKRTCTAFLSL